MGASLLPTHTLATPSCDRTAANLSPAGASLARVQSGRSGTTYPVAILTLIT
jgi:hypothetical protein